MLGPPKPRRLDEPIAVSLEDLVPTNRFYRHLEAKLDLVFCTTSDRGRIVHRSLFADYPERVRSYHGTEPYGKAIRKRQVWVEPLFAEAKEWRGLRRLRLRGLLNANIQGWLIAAGQNLKRFLAAKGWGRRHAPCGSLVALPIEPLGLSDASG